MAVSGSHFIAMLYRINLVSQYWHMVTPPLRMVLVVLAEENSVVQEKEHLSI